MFTPGVAFALITLLLLGAAIALHITSANLSLPIAPSITLITILLPVLATFNTLYYPRLLHAARATSSSIERILPQALQSLQAILTTALASLLLQYTLSSPLLDCTLNTTWQRLFHAKSASRIRAIQDAFDCCGFRSPSDRPWPFPSRDVSPLQCATRFDRTAPCADRWRAALQRNAGLTLAVVLTVGCLQITSLVMARGANTWRNAWWAQRGWRRIAPSRSGSGHQQRDGIERPLLGAPEAQEEGADSDVPVSYGDLSPTARPRRGVDDGAVENGFRVQPSSMERSAWGGQ
ncbi:hypothetical protein ACHAQH_002730 [Verticillium albo-atrum]